MRSCISKILVTVLLVPVSRAQATPIITVNDVANSGIPTSDVSTGGLDLFTFAIDNVIDEDYDTIDVEIIPHLGKSFVLDNRRRSLLLFPVPGSDDTFFHNSLLLQGLALFDVEESAKRLSGVVSTLGGPPTSTFKGDFAQVVGEPGLGFDYTIRFALAGNQVLDTVSGAVGPIIPEPNTLVLTSLLSVGLLGRRCIRKS